MIVQLDEGVPVRLARALAERGLRVLRFPNGWKGLSDRVLLDRLDSHRITCLVTCDKNLHHQQNLTRHGLAVVVLAVHRFPDMLPILDAIADGIRGARPGRALLVDRAGDIRVP